MDILDRLLAHDSWTTRQLLLACQALPEAAWEQEFEIDHHSLRATFLHLIDNMEGWTDLLYGRPRTERSGDTPAALLERLTVISREFIVLARRIARENREDDVFMDVLDEPPVPKTFGGAIAHLITHNMHHRAQIMFLMEKVGLTQHIEGDLLSWEATAHGWQ